MYCCLYCQFLGSLGDTERGGAMKRELIRAVSKSKDKPEHIFPVWFYFFVFDFCAKH